MKLNFRFLKSGAIFLKWVMQVNYKTATNYPISSNSQPSATANKAMHGLKWRDVQNQWEHHIILTKYEAVRLMAVSERNSSLWMLIILTKISEQLTSKVAICTIRIFLLTAFVNLIYLGPNRKVLIVNNTGLISLKNKWCTLVSQ